MAVTPARRAPIRLPRPGPRAGAPATGLAAAAAHDRVYRTLRVRIMHGELSPGEALTLRGIAGRFGVSMTPVREALRRLVAEGALTMSASGRVATPDPRTSASKSWPRCARCWNPNWPAAPCRAPMAR